MHPWSASAIGGAPGDGSWPFASLSGGYGQKVVFSAYGMPERVIAMFMASLRSTIRVLTRNGLFPLFLMLLAAYFALPSIIPGETGSFAFEAEHIKANRLDILEEAVSSGAYDTAPQGIRDANGRQLELLRATQGDDIAASLKAQAEIARIDMELYEDGNLSADPVLLEASRVLLDGLAGLEDPVLFETTAQEPMVYRLAEALGTVPPLLLFVPQVALAFAAYRSIESDRLGFQLPIGEAGKIAVAALAVLLVSVVGFALALVPSAILSALRNGVGDLSYPVVMIQGGSVLKLTVLSALFRSAAMLLAVTVFVSSVSAALFAASRTAVPGCLVLVALGFVPSIPQYFSETFILHDALPFLPTTYLYIAPVAGWPAYLNLMDVLPAKGATWELGMCVLLGVSAVLVFVAAAICAIARRGRNRMGRGLHARV